MKKLRVLLAHNYYLRAGGEDRAFENEVELLREHGHEVVTYIRRNEELETIGGLRSAFGTIWSHSTQIQLGRILDQGQFDVAHFHNTFPLISPSGYQAAKSRGIPVVQTLHNYRLTCPAATHFRDGGPCEDCLGKTIPWPSVLHACYRESRPLNALVASMLAGHKIAGSYRNNVDRYIVLSTFMAELLQRGGFTADALSIKPNFMPDPGVGQEPRSEALFVGRLSQEKGLFTLLDAWEDLPELSLRILGTGPLEGRLRSELRARDLDTVSLEGHQDHEQVLHALRQAALMIVPSLSYEGLPTTVIEAFACGTPVVVSDHGALAGMVEHGKQGIRFAPGDPVGLAQAVHTLVSDDEARRKMGKTARRAYERTYTPARNYTRLMEIYGQVLAA